MEANENQNNKESKEDIGFDYKLLPNHIEPWKHRWETASTYYLQNKRGDLYRVSKSLPCGNDILPKTENSTENSCIFFKDRKFYELTSSGISWSYYESGPYQLFETSIILPCKESKNLSDWDKFKSIENNYYFVNRVSGHVTFKNVLQDPDLLEKPWIKFTSNYNKEIYYNTTTEVFDQSPTGKCFESEKKDTKNDNNDSNNVKVSLLNFGKTSINPKIVEENIKYSDKLKIYLKDYYESDAIKIWRATIISGHAKDSPLVKTKKSIDIFDQITEAAKLKYVKLTNYSGRDYANLDDIDDLKYYCTVIVPEFCLYPKSIWKKFAYTPLILCSRIMLKPINEYQHLNYLAISGKNIMNLQKAFHKCICECLIENDKSDKSEAILNQWQSFNPPDFIYSPKVEVLPKGLKGFLSLAAIQSFNEDLKDIFAGLMRDPKNLLTHSDIIIRKKAALTKKWLEATDPDGINDEWWDSISNYKDVIELALDKDFDLYTKNEN